MMDVSVNNKRLVHRGGTTGSSSSSDNSMDPDMTGRKVKVRVLPGTEKNSAEAMSPGFALFLPNTSQKARNDTPSKGSKLESRYLSRLISMKTGLCCVLVVCVGAIFFLTTVGFAFSRSNPRSEAYSKLIQLRVSGNELPGFYKISDMLSSNPKLVTELNEPKLPRNKFIELHGSWVPPSTVKQQIVVEQSAIDHSKYPQTVTNSVPRDPASLDRRAERERARQAAVLAAKNQIENMAFCRSSLQREKSSLRGTNSFNIEQSEELLLASKEYSLLSTSYNEKYITQPNFQTERMHVVLMYEKILRSYLCIIESIVNSVFNSDKSVEIFIWVRDINSVKNNKDLVVLLRHFEKRFEKSKGSIALRFKEMDLMMALAGTSLEPFFKCADERKVDLGVYAEYNKGDAIRLGLLQKLGGMYFDADFVVTNDPTLLDDGMAQEQSDGFNGAVLKFHRADDPSPDNSMHSWRLLDMLMREFVEGYDGARWAWQGPHLLSRIAKKYCDVFSPDKHFDYFLEHSVECADDAGHKFSFKQWGMRRIYPLPWWEKPDKLKAFDEIAKKYQTDFTTPSQSMMVHLWHHDTIAEESTSCKHGRKEYTSTTVGRLREMYCPAVLEDMYNSTDCDF